MPTRAYLYDATATDQEIELMAQATAGLHEKHLLWVDVSSVDETELRRLTSLLGLKRDSLLMLLQNEHRPRLDNYGVYSQFNIHTIQETNRKYKLVEVDFVLGSNLVVTVHRHPVAFLDSFDRRIKGDSDLGELDARLFWRLYWTGMSPAISGFWKIWKRKWI